MRVNWRRRSDKIHKATVDLARSTDLGDVGRKADQRQGGGRSRCFGAGKPLLGPLGARRIEKTLTVMVVVVKVAYGSGQ